MSLSAGAVGMLFFIGVLIGMCLMYVAIMTAEMAAYRRKHEQEPPEQQK